MSSKLESDVCCRLQVALSGESYEGLTESNGRLLLGICRDSLHATCGLTACTPGSAPGPTLGNEYGKTLPFLPPILTHPTCIWPPVGGDPGRISRKIFGFRKLESLGYRVVLFV